MMSVASHHIFPSRSPKTLFGVQFDDETVEGLAAAIATTPLPGQGVRLVVTANVDHVVQLRSNASLRDAYRHSWRRTIDGMPVWLYARFRRVSVRGRVTGADLVPALLPRLTAGQHRLLFAVATPEIGRRLVEWAIRAGFGPDAVLIEVPPFGFEFDRSYGAALADRIRTHGTTHLFFGVGCPRSEIWIDRHRDQLGDLYGLAVGAGLGFFVGSNRRSPKLVSRVGLEWVWRVCEEPRRLAPRYFVRGWGFFAAVADDIFGSREKP